eukprot:c16003_g2_i1 orf=579-785(-)
MNLELCNMALNANIPSLNGKFIMNPASKVLNYDLFSSIQTLTCHPLIPSLSQFSLLPVLSVIPLHSHG